MVRRIRVKYIAHLRGSSLAANLDFISGVSLMLAGCPDEVRVAKTCSEQISELGSVCPAGQVPF